MFRINVTRDQIFHSNFFKLTANDNHFMIGLLVDTYHLGDTI